MFADTKDSSSACPSCDDDLANLDTNYQEGRRLEGDWRMKVISLFSGAGGMDLGFIQAGHEVVWANDIDPDCIRTYRRNIGNHIVLGDIRGIKSENIPDADIIIGGFPCQGFSVANMRRGPEDERNMLYLEFLRLLHDKQPKYFVAENVKGLLSLDGGRVIKKIVEDFEGVGYRVRHRVLNAADYGVPQTRMRVIILGTRADLPRAAEPQFPEPSNSKTGGSSLEPGVSPWVSVGEALAGIPDPDSEHNLLNHIGSKYKVNGRNFTGHRLTDPRKPSPTILARGNGRGGVCAIPHPNGKRRMTIRESATIQSFPIDFEFLGSMGSMYRQIGNAVPVQLAKRIAEKFSELEVRSD